MQKRILVTGGAGFIGSNLVDRLLKLGWSVTALDNFDDFYAAELKRANLAEARQNPAFKLVEADIRDDTTVMALFAQERFSAVVHLAARAGVRPSIRQPALYADVNVRGTINLLEAARHHGVEKFIFASSSSVYGNNPKVPFSEDDPVDNPISPYAATKKAGELICYTYHHLYGMNIFCLRLFTVYGPRCRPDLAVAKFTRLIDAGKPIPVFGDGSSQRDYTYIDDILDGIIAAVERCRGYRIYNLGESEPIRLSDMIDTISRALGKPAKCEHLPPQPGDVIRTFADITRAQAELDYRPKTPFSQGIENYIKWYRQNKDLIDRAMPLK